ncbi:MAG: 4-hydroxybenzoate octaprenyltransferase [Rhodothalassiaceae bacterium]|nr:MAG: 4-hydroxybenzoate octaprenyltransferase [Rhodothalassiaceae bacterium]
MTAKRNGAGGGAEGGADLRLTPDSVLGSLVAAAPARLRPYLKLARVDRPTGYWLLLWPCWWSLALAAPLDQPLRWWQMALFLIGAVVMRAAGCVWNDILDRDLDARVARTRDRPLPAGEVSVRAAIVFLCLLLLAGLAVLLQFNRFTVILGASSLLLVAVYPLMKRITDWPQAVLGLTFTWGALMGWAAVHGRLDPPAFLLYGASFFWALGYDTIYALQDARDDAVAGIRSSARALGPWTKAGVLIFYALTWLMMAAAAIAAGLPPVTIGLLLPALAHLLWQVRRLDPADPALALKLFRANGAFGWLPFVAFALGRGVLAA